MTTGWGMEWGALAIPVLMTVVALLYWRRRFSWWESGIPVLVCVVAIFVSRIVAERVITGDTEYWGSYATSAEYYEEWEEVDTEIVTDEKGNTSTKTTYTTHPAHWQLVDNVGQELSISEGSYKSLVDLWRNEEFENITRFNASRDGDKYYTTYDHNEKHLLPLTTEHRYTNRVRVSKSVFRQYNNKPDSGKLFDYPAVVNYSQETVLGGGKNIGLAQEYITAYNAKTGSRKQVRIFILSFPASDGVETGMAQESYWEGGNKNEVVVCVGIKEGKIEWCYPFSWCEVDMLKVKLRQDILGFPEADMLQIAKKTTELVDQMFVRKKFREFAYISVQLPGWVIGMIYLISFIVSIATLVWACNNQFNSEDNQIRRGCASFNDTSLSFYSRNRRNRR
jgi:hypothetical protein